MSDEPYYLPISRKGEYRFKCIFDSGKILIKDSVIDNGEKKIEHIKKMKTKFKLNVKLLYFLCGLLFVLNVVIIYYNLTLEKENEKPHNTEIEMDKMQELFNKNVEVDIKE